MQPHAPSLAHVRSTSGRRRCTTESNPWRTKDASSSSSREHLDSPPDSRGRCRRRREAAAAARFPTKLPRLLPSPDPVEEGAGRERESQATTIRRGLPQSRYCSSGSSSPWSGGGERAREVALRRGEQVGDRDEQHADGERSREEREMAER